MEQVAELSTLMPNTTLLNRLSISRVCHGKLFLDGLSNNIHGCAQSLFEEMRPLSIPLDLWPMTAQKGEGALED